MKQPEKDVQRKIGKLCVAISAMSLFVHPVMGATVSASQISAARGGESGGGGDPLALEFKATTEAALKNLQSLKGAPFNGLNLNQLQNKLDGAQVLISDDDLVVSKDGVNQNSAAENRPQQNLIILNRKEYQGIANSSVQQSLALHEILSLAGIESTGNYPISASYLIAMGGSSSEAPQTISSAVKSVSTQTPCAEPNSDALGLFSMIAQPGTQASAVKSFLRTHVVAWDALNDQCETSAEFALDQNRQDIFQVLFDQYQLNLSAPSVTGWNSIYSHVLQHNTPEVLGFLRSEASSHQQVLSLAPTSVGNQGATELMLGTTNPSVQMIQYLIQTGSSVNATDSKGRTALMYAAKLNPQASVAQALIQAKANIEAADSQGETALIYAAYASNLNVVLVLIHAKANLNARTSNGLFSALGIAAQHDSDVSVAQALIDAGVNPNTANSAGTTPLMAAAGFNPTASMIQMLIQRGATLNVGDRDGATPLMYAVHYNSNPAVTQALINAQALVNAVDSKGLTVLMYAAIPNGTVHYYEESLQDQVIQELIQAGVDIYAMTPMKGNDLLDDDAPETALDMAKKDNAPKSILQLLGG